MKKDNKTPQKETSKSEDGKSTDEAVDEIVQSEADQLIESEDQKAPGAPDVPSKLRKTIKEEESKKTKSADNSSPLDNDDVAAEDNSPDNAGFNRANNSPSEQVIDSEKTDAAVADIVRKEGDELLDNYDQQDPGTIVKPKKSGSKRKWITWTIILLVVATLIALMAIPQTRYAILNKLGVRVSASLEVVDNTTGQPLKNVTVELGGQSVQTNQDGHASFDGLLQGPQGLKISRVAFGLVEKTVTLGWGSNPLGSFELQPAGAQYTFIIHDTLADQPIEGAEVTSGQAVAKSDKDGKAVLTLEKTFQAEVTVAVSANNYRTEETKLAVNTSEEISVKLVPAQKAVFVSSASGKYNLYSMYIDGKARETILEGTGNESSDMSLAVSTDGSRVALVSTRDNIKNEDGSLLETLTLVDINGQNNQSLERAAKVQIIDWIGSVLIYRITSPGVSQDSNTRQKLMSYDISNSKSTELASANDFKSVASAQGSIYYSTGSDQYIVVNPDGSGKSTVLTANVEHAYRVAYGALTLQAGSSWYELSLNTNSTTQPGNPSSTQNRVYVSSQEGERSLWVGGTTLNVYSVSNNSDSALHSQANLSYPVRWLNSETVMFRDGGADYVKSTKGGDARKVSDVISTTGLVQTY